MTAPRYTGRFAPSPTGPLHIGSLFTALASFLDARSHKGLWLLRIDDLDKPRNRPGAADNILRTLENFGLHWDKQVVYQSQHLETYTSAIDLLTTQNLLYACNCSRKSLMISNVLSEQETIYPGFCRVKNIDLTKLHALRIKTESWQISFSDRMQGNVSENLALQHGDFIVKRKDQITAYPLAVVIDDHLQGVNQVVRGADLLDATNKQVFLHQCFNFKLPEYMHVPVIVGANGDKLSKKDFAPEINQSNCSQTLFFLLELLGQQPPTELKNESTETILNWAITFWNPTPLINIRSKPLMLEQFIQL